MCPAATLWLQGEDSPLGQRCATCTVQPADKQLWNPTGLCRDQMGGKVETRQQTWMLHVIFAATFTPTHRVDPFFSLRFIYILIIYVCERVKVSLDPTGAAVTGGCEAPQCGC